MSMLFYCLDLMGVAVFAFSGVLAAARSKLDLLGGLTLAALTAVGGGTLRDVLLKRYPIFWINDTRYIKVILLATALGAGYIELFRPPGNSLLIADALALALFAISGAQVAEDKGQPLTVVVLMGTMTSCAGGLLRDALRAHTPLLFQQELYATAAAGGILVYLALQKLGLPRNGAAVVGAVLILVIRLVALLKDLRLPQLQVRA
jgi:uncharacterized membrane protein YeiH